MAIQLHFHDITLQELHYFLPEMMVSVISVQILAWASMRIFYIWENILLMVEIHFLLENL